MYNSWKRKDEGAATEEQLDDKIKKIEAEDTQAQDSDQTREKWEGRHGQKDEKQEQWGCKGSDPKGVDDQQAGGKNQSHIDPESSHSADKSQNVACENCGLSNHSTKDRRRQFCEICGFTDHSAYDCKKCLPWNCGLELCAAQVEDQSFFYIEECIGPPFAMEKASTMST